MLQLVTTMLSGSPPSRDRLLDERHALRDRQQRGLARVVHDEHVQLVEDARRPPDDIEVAEGDRVERPRNDGDPAHALTLLGARYRAVTERHGAGRSVLGEVAPRRRHPVAARAPPRGPGAARAPGRPSSTPAASSRASAMSSPSFATRSSLRLERPPDWMPPSTSPSCRSSRSTWASSKPSSVAATASTRSRASVPSSAAVTNRHRPGHAAAPDPAAQLVQLRDAEPVGVEDDHRRRVGHVDADLDDGRGDEHVDARRRRRRA